MKLFAVCYTKFQPRRGWLILLLLALLVAGLWNLRHLAIEESIVAMLPDGNSRVADDFQRLQQAPFVRKLVIHLRIADGSDMDRAGLLSATDQLRDALPAELFERAVSGPQQEQMLPLLRGLGDYLPVLADAADLRQLDEWLTPEAIDRSLATDLNLLLQPQGIALKSRIQRDPLDLQRLALGRLRFLNPLPGVRIEQGHFLSSDGRSTLILADTRVLITDTRGAARLVGAFAEARAQLSPGITVDLLSGHPYTLANTTIIQQDMRKVLLISFGGILVLFLLFLRSWRALAVFILPLLSMLLALLAAQFWFGRLSGITVGFGAVLLGITIDFGLHVYFALRQGDGERADLVQAVAKPVLFGALTTLAAFAVLAGSALPGQRQLAFFAVAGILSALLLALLVLPHFVGGRQGFRGSRPLRSSFYLRHPRLRRLVLLVWGCGLVLCAVQAHKVHINGELRQLSFVPAGLRQAEERLAQVWGNMRGRALIFSSAADLTTAVARNEQVWQTLGELQLQEDVVSLAPLLPSAATQQEHLRNWQEFWQERRMEVEVLLRESGAKYGFAPNAFAPFVEQFDLPPQLLDVETLRNWGLSGMLDNLLLTQGTDTQLLTLIEDHPEQLTLLDEHLGKIPGVTLVSQSRFGRQLSREIADDFSRFILSASAVVIVLLLLLFRRLRPVLLALLPVASGLLAMFGGMGWLGLELNLFNLVAAILIIGLGVDYGIFMVCHTQQSQNLASVKAVLVSGLTTLAGFGALVLAEHPALYSIGVTVLLGISAAVPSAVLVIPALCLRRS